MKQKAFAVGALIVAFSNVLSAQNSPIQIGVEAGVAIAQLAGEEEEGRNSRKAPFAGVNLVVHKPGSTIGFQTGLLLMQKGATSDFEGSKSALEINYVEVPLLLRFALPVKSSKVVPALLVGATVAMKASCNITGESGSLSAKTACDADVFEGNLDVKTIDVGASAGFEVAIPVGQKFFIVPNLRYIKGLTNIVDAEGSGDEKNSTFQFGAAFRIRM